MIAVQQQRVNDTDGDCLAACIASIFERPLPEIPNFVAIRDRYPHWTYAVREWLRPANLTLTCCKDVDIPDGYSICTVNSKRFPGKYHAVVALNGEPVFDPSPTPDLDWAKSHICWYHVITVIDPLKPVQVDAIRKDGAA